MGCLLGSVLANIFMCSFESKWLRDCPNYFKPVFYRSYINDIFVLFSYPNHADKFREHLSSKYPNINFSIEKEKDGCYLFQMLTFFVKTRNLQLTSTGKMSSVGFIPTSKFSYT